MNKTLFSAAILAGFCAYPQMVTADESESPTPKPKTQATEQSITKKAGYLGVYPFGRTVDDALKLHLKINHGYVLGKLVPEGPAQKAGLKPNDILLKFNGKKIDTFESLVMAVGECKANQSVDIDVMQAGKTKTISIVLGERPVSATLVRPSPHQPFNEWLLKKLPDEGVDDEETTEEERAREELEAQEELFEELDELGTGNAYENLPDKLEVSLGEGLGTLKLKKYEFGVLVVIDRGGKKLYSATDDEGKVLVENGSPQKILKLGKEWRKALKDILKAEKKISKKAKKKGR